MTMIVVDGIESCRKAMGGHGYLLSSGVPLQYTSYLAQATYEVILWSKKLMSVTYRCRQGDFVVLAIQCGRGLLQMVQRHMGGKEQPTSSDSSQNYVTAFDPFATYIAPGEFNQEDFSNPSILVDKFERRYVILVGQRSLALPIST